MGGGDKFPSNFVYPNFLSFLVKNHEYLMLASEIQNFGLRKEIMMCLLQFVSKRAWQTISALYLE